MDEPDNIASAFLQAGIKRVLSARFEVPTLPTALIMECYSLEVDKCGSEITALSNARKWFRLSFAENGSCEMYFKQALLRVLIEKAGDVEYFKKEDRLETTVKHAFEEAIHSLRLDLYREYTNSTEIDKIKIAGTHLDSLLGFRDRNYNELLPYCLEDGDPPIEVLILFSGDSPVPIAPKLANKFS